MLLLHHASNRHYVEAVLSSCSSANRVRASVEAPTHSHRCAACMRIYISPALTRFFTHEWLAAQAMCADADKTSDGAEAVFDSSSAHSSKREHAVESSSDSSSNSSSDSGSDGECGQGKGDALLLADPDAVPSQIPGLPFRCVLLSPLLVLQKAVRHHCHCPRA